MYLVLLPWNAGGLQDGKGFSTVGRGLPAGLVVVRVAGPRNASLVVLGIADGGVEIGEEVISIAEGLLAASVEEGSTISDVDDSSGEETSSVDEGTSTASVKETSVDPGTADGGIEVGEKASTNDEGLSTGSGEGDAVVSVSADGSIEVADTIEKASSVVEGLSAVSVERGSVVSGTADGGIESVGKATSVEEGVPSASVDVYVGIGEEISSDVEEDSSAGTESTSDELAGGIESAIFDDTTSTLLTVASPILTGDGTYSCAVEETPRREVTAGELGDGVAEPGITEMLLKVLRLGFIIV